MLLRHLALASVLASLGTFTALADEGDPPSRVARLNYTSGSVSFRPGSVEEWTAARVNYPLTSGDHLWTEAGAQVEMHAGSTAIRMAPETAFAIVNLDDQVAQFSLTQGAIEIGIRDLPVGETCEVDLPNAAVSLLRPGVYRLEADGDRMVSTVVVRSGEAEFRGQDAVSPTPVRMGQSARLAGDALPAVSFGALPPPSEFDQWCDMRDRREEQSQSVRYVSRGTIGYEDLDAYGGWRNVPPYGWVWAPRVAAGWAPYHFGYWAWVEPWGWTWIADEPWGFAPFHYGRWAFAGGGWVWIPGAMAPRPMYAPALVAFVGGGGFTAGVAWFPLGPAEVYRPAYHVSPMYIQQINVAHVRVVDVNVVNVSYVNRAVPGAVVMVREDDFIHARPVAGAALAVDARAMERAQVLGHAPMVAPVRESVVMGPAAVGVHAPPARIVERATVTRMAPPPPPVPFRMKQDALRANPGRPLEPAAVESIRRAAPAPAVAPRGGGLRPAETARPAPAPAATPRNDRPPAARPADVAQPAPARQSEKPMSLERPTPAQQPEQPRTAERPAPARQPEPAKKTEAQTQQAPAHPAAAPAMEKKAPPKKDEKKTPDKQQ